jgi:hypothetical protein
MLIIVGCAIQDQVFRALLPPFAISNQSPDTSFPSQTGKTLNLCISPHIASCLCHILGWVNEGTEQAQIRELPVPAPQECQVIAQLGLRVLTLLLDILAWYLGKTIGGSYLVLSSHDNDNLE